MIELLVQQFSLVLNKPKTNNFLSNTHQKCLIVHKESAKYMANEVKPKQKLKQRKRKTKMRKHLS